MTSVTRLVAIMCAATCTMRCSTVQSEPSARAWPPWLHDCTIDGTGETARCGTVRVAESAALPAGRQIDIRVIVLPALTGTPAADPVVPLVGGPGQGAAELARPLSERFAMFRDQRDLVFVDQRGTGQSNGLHCPPRESAGALMGRIFDPEHLTACRDSLSARADFTQYTTAIAAGDYERVFDGLGYTQVNLVGTSYGTRMALELARRFPLRIRTVTLDAVVPTSFDWPTFGAADADAALTAVVDDCRADRACADSFPRFQQDIDVAFARLARGSVTATVRDPATGATERIPFGTSDLAYATRGLLYGNDAFWLPHMFRQAAESNYDAFAQAYVTRARTLDQQLARGVHVGVYCAEDIPFVDVAQAEKNAAGTHVGTYLLDQYRGACKIWPRSPIPPSFRDPVRTSVPTLLMAGRHDPVTPLRTAENVARTLPRSRVLIWRSGGHGTDGLISGECRTTILREFVESADPARLPADCVTRDAILPFRSTR
jgi:pimeloyl-ACP methyl ester carboxylesterase